MVSRKKDNRYNLYRNMIRRCYDTKNTDSYHLYGGRGIKVCDRWLEKKSGFDNFCEDMGERLEGYSLDRIDSNGDYEPSNCRWIFFEHQARNRRNSNSTVGVSFDRWSGKWAANMKTAGRYVLRGRFNTYEEAVIARKEAEKIYG